MTEVFVFGSNKAGRHGKGAALHARQHYGAIYGQSEGLQGLSYAIPTKDGALHSLPLAAIQGRVLTFLAFAAAHPDLTFRLTPIGCGLAGYKPEQIAPFFRDAPSNVILPDEFKAVLERPEMSEEITDAILWKAVEAADEWNSDYNISFDGMRVILLAVLPDLIAAERERCAKIADTAEGVLFEPLWPEDSASYACAAIAAAIRASQPKEM